MYQHPGPFRQKSPGPSPARARSLRAPAAPTAAWSFLGPQPVSNAKCCGINPTGNLAGIVSGRVTSLAVDPTSNGKTVFAGTAGGGVWKTTDSGATWIPVTDNQPSLAIGALAIDSTGQVIYAATGEGNHCIDCQFGQGILKSINGGATWTSLASANYPTGMGGIFTSRLAIDRTTSGPTQRVLAATNFGLIISNDGGNTWAANTNIPGATLALIGVPCSQTVCTGEVDEIVQDPTTNSFWAAMSDQCNSEAGNIAVSTDGGNNWTSNYDFPMVGFQNRIGLDVVGNVAYVAGADCAASAGAPSGNLDRIAKTIDGGTSWNPVPSTATGYFNYFNSGLGVGPTSGQGWYDTFVAIDPTNTMHVLFGGISLMATKDGGTSFANVGKVYSGGVAHPDQHTAAYFSPSGCSGSACSDHLYIGNDGGVWSTADLGGIGSVDPASSNHWSNQNATLATIQYYGGSAIDTNTLLGGAQDNGSPGHLPGAPASPNFPQYHGGDGFYTAVDPGSTTIFAEYPHLGIEKGKSTLNAADPFSPYDSFTPAAPCDGKTTTAACSDPVGFIAPFLMDSTNAQRLIAGTNKVYLTTNGGGTSGGPSNWTVISPDLTTGGSDNINALALLSGTNTMYAGSVLGRVMMTTNASTWTDITGNLPPLGSQFMPWITSIAANPANSSEVWVTLGTDLAPVPARVLHTTNAGAVAGTTWTDISGSGLTALPLAPAMSVVLDPRDPNTVYVGTYFGVQKCTTCGGATPSPSWSDAGSGLPNVQVAQLSLTRDGSTLIAWTHGRGVWALPLSVSSPSVATVVSTQQYTLAGNDGTTWVTMDATHLVKSVMPSVNSTAILGGNVDLWTNSPGYNQDVGLFVSDNGVADQLLAWKESGGFAGTFSPNAAFVQTVFPMTASHTYTFKLKWKTNKPEPGGVTIFAAAGGAATGFSPTRLTAEVLPAGPNPYTAATTQQYTLAGNDGSTWVTMDAINLVKSVTPSVNSTAILGGNVDLWTNTGGYNQDVALFVSDNGAADQLLAWKESGGFAGTFSPNAAFVQTVFPMTASHTYTFKLKWKTNKPEPGGVTIFAAAGGAATGFSPTRLTAEVLPAGPNPYTAATTQQYTLAGNDGSTWMPIDAINLVKSVTPSVNSTAILGGNVDLWTNTRGYNQDVALFVSDNGAADQLLAWKESGGFAGTFSPNAAFVQSVFPMTAGHTYTFKLKWKTNKPEPGGVTIFAAAGGATTGFSPTRVTAEIVG